MATMTEHGIHEAKVEKRGGGKRLHHLEVHVPKRKGHGHLITHHFDHEDGSFHEPEHHAFGPDQGEEALAHIAKHAKIHGGDSEEAEREEEVAEGEE